MENKAQAQWSNRPQVKKDEDRVDNQKGGKAGRGNKQGRKKCIKSQKIHNEK